MPDGLKVVVIQLNLRTLSDREAQTEENLLELVEHDVQRMLLADDNVLTRQGNVDGLRLQLLLADAGDIQQLLRTGEGAVLFPVGDDPLRQDLPHPGKRHQLFHRGTVQVQGLRRLVGEVLPRRRGPQEAALGGAAGVPGLEERRQQEEGRGRRQEAFFGFPKFSSHVGS